MRRYRGLARGAHGAAIHCPETGTRTGKALIKYRVLRHRCLRPSSADRREVFLWLGGAPYLPSIRPESAVGAGTPPQG